MKNKESLVLTHCEVKVIENNIQSGLVDVTNDEKIKRNITINLDRWHSRIHEITQDFYEKDVLAINKEEMDAINRLIMHAKRYNRLGTSLQELKERMAKSFVTCENEEVDENVKLWKNMKRKGCQQEVAATKLLMEVFDMKDKEGLASRYRNTDWKPKLLQHIKSMTQEEWNHTLSLYGLDVPKKRKQGDIDYRDRDCFGTRKARLGHTFVKTVMNDTYGVDFVADTEKFMKFDNNYWDKIMKNEKTFLNQIVEMVDNPEDFI